MPRKATPLKAATLPFLKPGKHFDGGGLYFHVVGGPKRYWRLKYQYGGVERIMSFGAFPEVTLAEARQRRDEAREELRVNGVDPMAAKAAREATQRRNTEAAFPKVATAWLAFKQPEWAETTYRKAQYVIDTYLVPALQKQSLDSLSTKEASAALRNIPPALGKKARQYLSAIVDYAIHEGLREDGKLLSLRGSIRKVDKGHIAAATTLVDLRMVVKAVYDYRVPVTRAGLLIAMATAQRPGVVAAMEWAELDLEDATWSIPAAKMKTRHAHIVPLPKQAIEVLRKMLAYSDGMRYVFPPLARQKTEHLHRDSLSAALRRMGLQGTHATHGFRAMFRTLGRERLGIDVDILEAQLAHSKRGEVQKAYDRTRFDDARRTAMQQWADFLDAQRTMAAKTVVPIKAVG